jgi:putative transposase
MYDWRKMSPAEQAQTLATRKIKTHPWHSPPHRYLPGVRQYLLTAACFEHEPIIAHSAERLDEFTDQLLTTCEKSADKIFAWCVLPNHYHVLLQTPDLRSLLHEIGLMHGRLSFTWNGEEETRGRQVWCNCVDREMRSYRHSMASLNYAHHNPVRHGYVERWQDWPWSSAGRFLAEVGRERAEEIWRAYPIKDYGAGWDDFSFDSRCARTSG